MDKEILLHNYFEGTLLDHEKEAFQKLLSEDAEFAKDFAFQKNLKTAITLHERNELKKKLKSFENKKAKSSRRLPLAVAACMVALIGIFFIMKNPDRNSDSLYARFYQPYPNTIAPIVRGENGEDIKSKAFYAYENKDYKKSAALFSELGKTENSQYPLLYEGIALMELGKFNEAIVVFIKLKESPEDPFQYYIKWYLALCYLRTGEEEKTASILKMLIITENPLQENAERLLEALE